MSEALSKTLHGDFDSVFHEVTQPEKVAWTTEGQLRLFHLNIRNNKFNPEEMKTLLYRNIGEYVFSRAKIENFKVSGDAFAVGAQAIRVINKNGSADVKGTGAELGEMLLYSFLEEKLKAPKLMSRVELSTDAKQYASTCDGIHLLTSGTSGLPYHQVVFGASRIVGDLTYAIDAAFNSILEIENNEDNELHMVDTALYPLHEFPDIAEEKMQADIKRNTDYILNKIQVNGLGQHSFYFYVLPFNDAETEKKAIMEAVLKGDVDL